MNEGGSADSGDCEFKRNRLEAIVVLTVSSRKTTFQSKRTRE
jgi:hypothetical protein